MKLIEQQNIRTSSDDKIQAIRYTKRQHHYLNDFNRFQKSIETMIKIHFIRFFVVTILYYYSDVFLTRNQPNSSQPWNSLMYFLAMMIQIIKFIGDCSVRNILKNQKSKFQQIHKVRQSLISQINNQINSSSLNHNNSIQGNIIEDANVNVNGNADNNNNNNNNNDVINIINIIRYRNLPTLKAATYQDYLSIYSMVQIFKYKHRNYSSAFSISKYMHVICTFFIFGWMSARELFNDESILHNLIFLIFITSIYLTSFEIDLYMIQTSQGKNGKIYGKNQHLLTNLTQNEKQDVKQNFKKWRKYHLIIQQIATIQLGIALFIDLKISFLTFVIVFVLSVNIIGYYFQNIILDNCANSINLLKKQQINTYFILQKSIKPIRHLYKYFIVIQRFSILLLSFAFARDSSLSLITFIAVFSGIIILIANQNRKFNQGMKMTLMRIRQIKYVKEKQKYNEQFKQNQCSICLRVIQSNQIVNILPCSKQHIFHKNCLFDWTKHKKQCPLCRFSLADYI